MSIKIDWSVILEKLIIAVVPILIEKIVQWLQNAEPEDIAKAIDKAQRVASIIDTNKKANAPASA